MSKISVSKRPNVLFLMADQMQAEVLRPGHSCQIPHLRRLMDRGVWIENAYTPSPTCSPARASLMTGTLPHTHGVLQVTHCVDPKHVQPKPGLTHWAQTLRDAGYATGYFGKWHAMPSDQLDAFGWDDFVVKGTPAWSDARASLNAGDENDWPFKQRIEVTGPAGYAPSLLAGVANRDPRHTNAGVAASLALDWLEKQDILERSWCCFVGATEPHDPFVCDPNAFGQYDAATIDLPDNTRDALVSRPNLYRKSARVFADLSEAERRVVRACYYACITELDAQFGRVLDWLDTSGQAENTVVVLSADHGELLGAHGLYCKNIGAFEEAYRVPMVLAGPGVTRRGVVVSRVGLQDVPPTLGELTGVTWPATGESASFAELLRADATHTTDDQYQTGYAEYFGTRYWLNQRVIWDGPWKLVWNGFDFDELYDLSKDPGECVNRIDDPSCGEVLGRLMRRAWAICERTDDHTLLNANYSPMRVAPRGPGI